MKNTTIKLIFGGILILGGLFLFQNSAQADFVQSGGSNAFSAGGIVDVPAGYALTGIGYGSDDHNCTITIFTSPLNADKTRSSAQPIQRAFGCSAGFGNDGFLSHFVSVPLGHAIVGWSWGANTTGGRPNDDSFPNDECVYQEYTNLATGEVSSFFSTHAGSCASRAYGPSDLKFVARAPSGEVIVGIDLSLGDDADVTWVGADTRLLTPICAAGQYVSGGSCVPVSGTLGVGPAGSGQSLPSMNCTAVCNPEVHWRTFGKAGRLLRDGSEISGPSGDFIDSSANFTTSPPNPHQYKIQAQDENFTWFDVGIATVNVTASAPTATLTCNGNSTGTPNTSVTAGDDVTYNWSSTNGTSYSSTYSSSSCGTGSAAPMGNSSSGLHVQHLSQATDPCSPYLMTYTVTNSSGSASDSCNLIINPLSKTATLSVSATQINLSPGTTSSTATVSNSAATNGGSFTVGSGSPGVCPVSGSTLPPGSTFIATCPSSSMGLGGSGNLSVSVSNPPVSGSQSSANITVAATGESGTIVSGSPKTVNVTYTPPNAPTATLTCTVGGVTSHSCTAPVGTNITYNWSSTNGSTYSSTVSTQNTPAGNASCAPSGTPWSAGNSASGTTSGNTDANQPACGQFTLRYTVTSSSGVPATDTIHVTVSNSVNGQCAVPPHGSSYSSAPSGPLCAAGTASPSSLSGAGPWNWTCNGSGTPVGTSASCNASVTGAAVNGSCGSSSGGTFSSAPTSNLCNSGSASAVAGSGPWTWSCTGSGAGHSDALNCSANKTAAPPPPPPPPVGNVTLSANPNSGNAPLNVTFTAQTSDSGWFFYYYYCDRQQTDSLPPVPAPTGIAGGSLIPNQTATFNCTYPSGGTYFGKIIPWRVYGPQCNAFTNTEGSGSCIFRGFDSGAWRQAWAPVAVASAPPMSGVLTPAASSCIITAGASSCNINFSWSTTNPVATSAVTKNPNVTVANGNSGNNVPLAVKHNTETFFLFNNAVALSQSTVSSSCAAGSAWDGSVCAASANVTISANPTSIFTGGSSTLTWSSNAVSCAGTNFSTGGAPSGNISVSPTSTTTYTVTCNGVSANATVTVKKKPFFIEN